jgi:hypothetical protein
MAGPNHRQKREPPNARKAKRVSDPMQRKKQDLTLFSLPRMASFPIFLATLDCIGTSIATGF